ncbi:hypothetical protein HN011_005523 [Eciton burchellii]|nr:hypothetical protein HN011_005523 [Eciton burchellii]
MIPTRKRSEHREAINDSIINATVPSMSPRNGSCVAEVSSVRSLSSDDVSATKANRKKSCWARATDPAHRRGRRIQLLQMLVLPFIPILALIVQTANTLHDILIYRQEVSDIETQVSSGGRCDKGLRSRT